MPLINKEPDLYPESLFSLPPEEAPWRIAYVKSRCEKAFARHLLERQVPFYLPTQQKRHFSGNRERIARLPLFPGYVFIRGERPERLAALQSQRVVRLMSVTDQQTLHRELQDLKQLQDEGFLLVSHPYLEPGDPVEILEGPFQGYQGLVERERGVERLVVSVTFLRQSASVEVPRDELRPLKLPRANPRPQGAHQAA
jgi:transcription antitermination factor NusG